MTSVEVMGRQVAIPVEIRDARSWFASFLVPMPAARALTEPAGLEPAKAIGGRAMLSLAFVRYVDGDLGPYNEVAVALLVRAPAWGGRGAYIHRLPVDQEFSCAAGRGIWGFPKFVAGITIAEGRHGDACELVDDGRVALGLSVRHGLPTPMRATALDAYSFTDGVLRRTSWSLDGSGSRMRPGGARLQLGDHPIADELRSLGLPRRALMSGGIRSVQMRFGAAEVVERAR